MSITTKQSAELASSVAIVPHIVQPKSLYIENFSLGRVHPIEHAFRPLSINVQNLVASADDYYEV